MILYLIKSTLLLGVLLALYKLLLENEKMHRFNRFYLLAALVFGLSAPLISIDLNPETKIGGVEVAAIESVVHAPTERISKTVASVVSPATELTQTVDEYSQATEASPQPDLRTVLTGLYFFIFALLAVRFISGLIQIRKHIRAGDTETYRTSNLVLLSKPITPQSFLHYIFLNKDDYKSGKIGEEILEHELTHVRQYHSVDIMFIELLKLIIWFNPLLYFYKHSIQLNHEFLADEYVVKKVSSISNYQQKLLEVCEAKVLMPVSSSFNASHTKKRFTMLSKKVLRLRNQIKIFTVIPLVVGFSVLSTLNIQAQDLKKATVYELTSELQTKIDGNESLTKEDKQALSNLVQSIDKYKMISGSKFVSDDPEIIKLWTEHERLNTSYKKLVNEYLKTASEEGMSVTKLNEIYSKIKVLNQSSGDAFNKLRKARGELNTVPNPPLPPSPEKLLSNH